MLALARLIGSGLYVANWAFWDLFWVEKNLSILFLKMNQKGSKRSDSNCRAKQNETN